MWSCVGRNTKMDGEQNKTKLVEDKSVTRDKTRPKLVERMKASLENV